MASFHAIAVTARALKGLLTNAAPGFAAANPTISLFRAKELQNPPEFDGVSIYLHRLAFNASRRSLPPRQAPDGTRYRPSTPVDAHFLFTAWAKDPETQLSIMGWALRTLQDSPVLPAGFLNSYAGEGEEVFHPDETVELVGEILTAQDFVNIFGSSGASQQPSLSYVARMVSIDSELAQTEAGPVQTRVLAGAKIIS